MDIMSSGCWRLSYCGRDHQGGLCQGFRCQMRLQHLDSLPDKAIYREHFPGQILHLFTAPLPTSYSISRSAETLVPVVPGPHWAGKDTKAQSGCFHPWGRNVKEI